MIDINKLGGILTQRGIEPNTFDNRKFQVDHIESRFRFKNPNLSKFILEKSQDNNKYIEPLKNFVMVDTTN